jgi:membrane protein insertase Oxa1/YidC/SpoIIIJ
MSKWRWWNEHTLLDSHRFPFYWQVYSYSLAALQAREATGLDSFRLCPTIPVSYSQRIYISPFATPRLYHRSLIKEVYYLLFKSVSWIPKVLGRWTATRVRFFHFTTVIVLLLTTPFSHQLLKSHGKVGKKEQFLSCPYPRFNTWL